MVGPRVDGPSPGVPMANDQGPQRRTPCAYTPPHSNMAPRVSHRRENEPSALRIAAAESPGHGTGCRGRGWSVATNGSRSAGGNCPLMGAPSAAVQTVGDLEPDERGDGDAVQFEADVWGPSGGGAIRAVNSTRRPTGSTSGRAGSHRVEPDGRRRVGGTRGAVRGSDRAPVPNESDPLERPDPQRRAVQGKLHPLGDRAERARVVDRT